MQGLKDWLYVCRRDAVDFLVRALEGAVIVAALWHLWFMARFRLDLNAVCEADLVWPEGAYHDYHDSVEGHPDHFVPLTCKRCKREFYI